MAIDNNILRQMMGVPQEEDNELPIPYRAPAAEVQAPIAPAESIIQEQTAADLLSQHAVPREANYQAPKIQIPQVDPETAKARAAQEKAILDKLNGLDENYKKELQDAEDRKFNSSIFAAIGNYLPSAIAGATAANTKAVVHAPQLPQITPTDSVGQAHAKHKTEYENLLGRYKALKEGALSPKDLLYANIAQANADMGANRLNANIQNTDRNAGIRVGSAILKDQKDNELSDKQVKEDTDMANTLDEIRKVTDQAEQFKDRLGPNAAAYERAKEGRLGAIVPGKIDKDYVKFRSDAKALKGQYQKIISGLTLSDQERKELASYVPNEEMPYETFKASAEAFERRVQDLRSKTNKNLEKKQGKNVQGYGASEEKTITKREYSPSRNQTRITYSDGSTEIKDGK